MKLDFIEIIIVIFMIGFLGIVWALQIIYPTGGLKCLNSGGIYNISEKKCISNF